MEARFHDNVNGFWQATRRLYEADPVRHTTALTVVRAELTQPTQRGEPALFLTLEDGDELRAAALRTPPWPLQVSGVPIEFIPRVAVEWHRVDPGLSTVVGPRNLVETFAVEWTKLTGGAARIVCELRLYRLGELSTPKVQGHARLATEDDIALLATYWLSFTRDTHLSHPTDLAEAEDVVKRALALGAGALIWEFAGEPVALAVARMPVGCMSRIGPVYTPPESRRHGYASAATAAAATWAVNAGAEHVLLYTDLANPTSNSIYQRIGFRPVADYLEVAF